MKIRLFYHSIISAWNHGNAHFLRGVCHALVEQGHDVIVFEPRDGWSLRNLLNAEPDAIEQFQRHYPRSRHAFYDQNDPQLDTLLHDADLVIVHEWNPHDLVRAVGEHRKRHSYTLFFHDTHHRAVSMPAEMARYDLSGYDAVLAFGASLATVYAKNAWAGRVFSWHEAADTTTHHPIPGTRKEGDLVWIGNWGDDERSEELQEFIIGPVERLGLKATFHGVRYPEHALRRLKEAGITYGGYLPSHRIAEVFSAHHLTVHVPRRFYARQLPGIPTIRPFEAMACGIPLLSAPWEDSEGMFTPGRDLIMVKDEKEMEYWMRRLLGSPQEARAFATHARDTIERRHTCAHRAAELLGFHQEVKRQEKMIMDDISS